MRRKFPWESKYRVEIALIHEIAAEARAIAVGEKHIVRQYHRRPRLAVTLQTAINMLEEIDLLVARREGEIVPRGTLAAFFRTKRRIKDYLQSTSRIPLI